MGRELIRCTKNSEQKYVDAHQLPVDNLVTNNNVLFPGIKAQESHARNSLETFCIVMVTWQSAMCRPKKSTEARKMSIKKTAGGWIPTIYLCTNTQSQTKLYCVSNEELPQLPPSVCNHFFPPGCTETAGSMITNVLLLCLVQLNTSPLEVPLTRSLSFYRHLYKYNCSIQDALNMVTNKQKT